jgi:hypothetical protein
MSSSEGESEGRERSSHFINSSSLNVNSNVGGGSAVSSSG